MTKEGLKRLIDEHSIELDKESERVNVSPIYTDYYYVIKPIEEGLLVESLIPYDNSMFVVNTDDKLDRVILVNKLPESIDKNYIRDEYLKNLKADNITDVTEIIDKYVSRYKVRIDVVLELLTTALGILEKEGIKKVKDELENLKDLSEKIDTINRFDIEAMKKIYNGEGLEVLENLNRQVTDLINTLITKMNEVTTDTSK